MKYLTKQKRLVAIFEAYCAKFKKTAATTEEVSVWALGNKLYPCPRKGDADDVCEAWERRLEKATA